MQNEEFTQRHEQKQMFKIKHIVSLVRQILVHVFKQRFGVKHFLLVKEKASKCVVYVAIIHHITNSPFDVLTRVVIYFLQQRKDRKTRWKRN